MFDSTARPTLWLAGWLLALGACATDTAEGGSDGGTSASDGGGAAETRFGVCASPCGSGQICVGNQCVDANDPSALYVLSEVAIPSVQEGTAPGLDLDGLVSDELDSEGCETPDFTSPDGTEGVDNGLAPLLRELLPLLPGIVEGIDPELELDTSRGLASIAGSFLQDGTITVGVVLTPSGDTLEGRLVRLTPVDGLQTEGNGLAAGQRFALAESSTLDARLTGVAPPRNDGTLSFGGLTVDFSLDFSGSELFPADMAWPLQVELEGVGFRAGLLQANPTAEVGLYVRTATVEALAPPDLSDVVGNLLTPDLRGGGRDGECDAISVGAAVTLVPGLLED